MTSLEKVEILKTVINTSKFNLYSTDIVGEVVCVSHTVWAVPKRNLQ